MLADRSRLNRLEYSLAALVYLAGILFSAGRRSGAKLYFINAELMHCHTNYKKRAFPSISSFTNSFSRGSKVVLSYCHV